MCKIAGYSPERLVFSLLYRCTETKGLQGGESWKQRCIGEDGNKIDLVSVSAARVSEPPSRPLRRRALPHHFSPSLPHLVVVAPPLLSRGREIMGVADFLPFRTTPTSHVLGTRRAPETRGAADPVFCHVVTDYPVFTTVLLACGALALGKFLIKTLGVLLQTFVLPGKSVSRAWRSCAAELTGRVARAAQEIWRGKRCMGRRDWCLGGNWTRIRVAAGKEGLQCPGYGAQQGCVGCPRKRDWCGLQYFLCPGKLTVSHQSLSLSLARRCKAVLWPWTSRSWTMSRSGLRSRLPSRTLTLVSSVRAIRDQTLAFSDTHTVNNVGRSHTFPADFIDAPEDEVDSILAININSVLKVTRAILPGMIQRCVCLSPRTELATDTITANAG